MFLSAISNLDLARGLAPWSEGLDWRRFGVIDSNVDLFLGSIDYRGGSSYDARRAFIQALGTEIDLREERAAVHANNPRVIQQTMFTFMSATNRRASENDCMGKATCARCPRPVRTRCPVVSLLGRV